MNFFTKGYTSIIKYLSILFLLHSGMGFSETIGNIDKITKTNSKEYLIESGQSKVKITFYKDDIFRIEAAPKGSFTKPKWQNKVSDIMVESYDFPAITTEYEDLGDYYLFKTKKLSLRAYKKPLVFQLFDTNNEKLVFKESKGLTWNNSGMTQSITRKKDDYFFGGGMQNGYFSHRDKKIQIKAVAKWEKGDTPNPAPFYMSNGGYGVFRNTWSNGTYDFKQTVKTVHKEQRFDAFYFYGPDLKNILNGYTTITGRPFLPPIWGLELGDADCYNKKGKKTPDVLEIANQYRKHDLPGGWMLPNDGYGCGYVDLPEVVEELHEKGFWTGLWTENGLKKLPWEVKTAGIRGNKLDIAWVHKGYAMALNAAKSAAQGVEKNSDARRFVWTTMGWAGTHRYAIVWSGDQSGSWDYIKWHIPTFIGSGLSAQNFASSDVDGIFRGSAKTYTRDLQFKTFIPVTYNMSGWAKHGKQPYVHGEPYTSINRKYLKLKMRLTPYMYTNSRIANTTGVPTVRGMVLEFPQDKKTWGTETEYQFMSGKNFLVAPVYEDTSKRSNIYLPKGTWTDYWNGKTYEGPQTINNYDAPFDKLPLFVREGAIIPMWPEMLHHREKPKNPITLDIYPKNSSSFELYEDDGLTRDYKKGSFSTQVFKSDASEKEISISIGENKGQYKGKLESRGYVLQIHKNNSPSSVTLDSKKLDKASSKEEFEKNATGWYFDKNEKNGVIFVKTPNIPSDTQSNVEFQYP